MQNDPIVSPTFTLTIDTRCRSCVLPRLLVRDFRAWDEYPDDGDVAELLAQHVERRCGPCADGCTVTEGPKGHFRVEIAAA
ncbi:hypothetical protein [Rhizobium ruizarguesonis]|uniref:hypothetical protein n=1 Tax=Rhizobium ruizarguesonis TaxID=2081791 RepID=UPI0010303A70|nr:hypothetical protein [Rhizobium ruizarguesonis]TAZ43542.1 hypothetical protein ELH76_37695 [Rhizobium ruizarguesonis]